MILKKRENRIFHYLASAMMLSAAVFTARAEEAPGQTAKAEQPDLLKDFLSGPMAGVDEIVLAVLLDDPEGSVRDPQVHYDGRKILFSYRKGGTESFFLYEINTDGTGLRQLTGGPDGRYDDIEPTYLPDVGIMFVSSRCDRWVNCWLTQVATLHRCDGDGRNIRVISANLEHDNTPWPLPDGRILYHRWEYVDRSQVHYHHLWTANRDGTGQTIYYGNMHPGIVMIDAKPLPGTDNKVVAVFSPSHGRREHNGRITIVSPKSGPDEKSSARQINPSKHFRDPYPLCEDCFLVVNGPAIFVMNGRGQTQEIYHLAKDLEEAGARCHEVRPLRKRPREKVIAPIADLSETSGRVVLTDVCRGRNMVGVRLAKRERDMIKLWIETGAPNPGTYAALGCGMIGGYAENRIDQSDRDWPSMKAKMKLMEKRCGRCHSGPMQLPASPSDNMGMPPWNINYESPKLRFSHHILYNLTRPQKSLLLLAPLSKEGGGHGLCKEKDEDGKPTDKPAVVFNGTCDADYRIMLAAIIETAERLEQIKRFDMPGFCPPAPYVREMKRYGILAADVAADSPMDVYATDREYWRSLWWKGY